MQRLKMAQITGVTILAQEGQQLTMEVGRVDIVSRLAMVTPSLLMSLALFLSKLPITTSHFCQASQALTIVATHS